MKTKIIAFSLILAALILAAAFLLSGSKNGGAFISILTCSAGSIVAIFSAPRKCARRSE